MLETSPAEEDSAEPARGDATGCTAAWLTAAAWAPGPTGLVVCVGEVSGFNDAALAEDTW
ncbi:MAG: hypothetical protein CK429_03435 [Mycobacterium sp.]|nr:MAG: hypothetical protein CK429_03435 [Mycobacterium sp.]